MNAGKILAMSGLLLATTLFSGEVLAADAEEGKVVFRKCIACHSPEAGVNKMGPSLFGIFGKTPGTVESFAKRYSPAMKAFGADGAVWDEATLDAYLASPRTTIPKNRMGFPGLKDATQRENVIAYLKTLIDE
ncbi:MAG: cytochrome c family protein [Sphingomonadales bacterium]